VFYGFGLSQLGGQVGAAFWLALSIVVFAA
jgi:hypothetical protein